MIVENTTNMKFWFVVCSFIWVLCLQLLCTFTFTYMFITSRKTDEAKTILIVILYVDASMEYGYNPGRLHQTEVDPTLTSTFCILLKIHCIHIQMYWIIQLMSSLVSVSFIYPKLLLLTLCTWIPYTPVFILTCNISYSSIQYNLCTLSVVSNLFYVSNPLCFYIQSVKHCHSGIHTTLIQFSHIVMSQIVCVSILLPYKTAIQGARVQQQ